MGRQPARVTSPPGSYPAGWLLEVMHGQGMITANERRQMSMDAPPGLFDAPYWEPRRLDRAAYLMVGWANDAFVAGLISLAVMVARRWA